MYKLIGDFDQLKDYGFKLQQGIWYKDFTLNGIRFILCFIHRNRKIMSNYSKYGMLLNCNVYAEIHKQYENLINKLIKAGLVIKEVQK